MKEEGRKGAGIRIHHEDTKDGRDTRDAKGTIRRRHGYGGQVHLRSTSYGGQGNPAVHHEGTKARRGREVRHKRHNPPSLCELPTSPRLPPSLCELWRTSRRTRWWTGGRKGHEAGAESMLDCRENRITAARAAGDGSRVVNAVSVVVSLPFSPHGKTT